MMRQDDQRHMMVPAAPEAQLVVVQPQFPLPLREAGLNRPAHAVDPDQGSERGVRRRVAQIVLHLGHRVIGDWAAQQHPDLWAGQTVARGDGAERGEVRHQRPPAPLQDAVAVPGVRG